MNNPLKISFKTEIIPILLVLVYVVASFYFYANFPARVITHWGFDGEPNGWSSPVFAAFFFPALILGIYLMFLALPLLDPKKDRYAEFSGTYHLLKVIFVLFFVGIYFLASLANLGYAIPIGTVVPFLVGLLFIVIGNYMGKLKRNWYIGIKTPWTLSSDVVWNKSHRLGGKMFMLAGVLMMIDGFVARALQLPLLIALISMVAIVPIVYSYIVYRKEKREKKSDTEKGS